MSETQETVEYTLDRIEGYANQLQQILKQHGPDVIEFSLTLGRVAAFNDLFMFFVSLLILPITVTLALKFLKTQYKHHLLYQEAIYENRKKAKDHDNQQNLHITFFLIFTAISMIFSFVALIHVQQFYAWVGLFYPEIYLAAKALGLT